MKYSIRGHLNASGGTSVVTLLNEYDLWEPLEPKQIIDRNGRNVFSFEVKLNTVEEKDSLFEDLKDYVNDFGGWVDWHECRHDEFYPGPCVIAETYRGD